MTFAMSPSSELPPNRAAFLFGFYLAAARIEAVTVPWLRICTVLPVSSVIVLDSALGRLRSLRAQLEALQNEDSLIPSVPHDVSFAHSPGFRAKELQLQYRLEARFLKDVASQLWGGHSRLKNWYEAGLLCGDLIQHLQTADFLQKPRQAGLEDSEFVEKQERAAKAIRYAYGGRVADVEPLRIAVMKLQLSSTTQEHAISTLCANVDLVPDSPSGGSSDSDIRNQYLYEQIMLHGCFGDELMNRANAERDRVWPLIAGQEKDKLREFANGYARRHGLQELPPGSPGRTLRPQTD